MKRFVIRYWQHIAVAALSVAVFCYWMYLFPFIPVVREMSQLFLWTGDYFVERIILPGGLAQYLGEMISQCFINPLNAAIAYAIIFLVARQLSGVWLRQFFPTLKVAYRFVLSLVVPAILWGIAMVPYIPLTLTVAVILVMGVGVLLNVECGMWNVKCGTWNVLIAIPVMYWLTGPAAVLLVLCCIRWAPATLTLFAACVIGSSYVTPYPLRQVAKGIDYIDYDADVGKEMGTYEEMECDMLFRQGKWQEIIRKFQHPESPAVRSAVVMAYHGNGKLGRRELIDNLVVPSGKQDSNPSVFNIGGLFFVVNFGSLSSAFMVSDMAMLLYWTNISQRAAFEAMEYIPNYNKSGRALKRLVETNIISGHYDVARKYLYILEKTAFYRKWAQSMRPLVDNPKLIESKPFYKAARKEYENTTDVFFI